MDKARYDTVCSILLCIGCFALASGALLHQAAANTGADSDYTKAVSWTAAFASTVWPPRNLPWFSLVGVAVIVGLTWWSAFHLSKAYGAAILALNAVAGFKSGGSLGFFFIGRELTTYHLRMDAERLGEHWFSFEAVAVWVVAVSVMAGLRVLLPAPRQ